MHMLGSPELLKCTLCPEVPSAGCLVVRLRYQDLRHPEYAYHRLPAYLPTFLPWGVSRSDSQTCTRGCADLGLN